MTKDPLYIALMRFVRDLLGHPEEFIKSGRQNFNRQHFEQPFIVVDSVAGDRTISSDSQFDGDTEAMLYSEYVSRLITFDFYGPDAFPNAQRFRLLCRSEASLELQQALQITVWHPGAMTDVKALTGQQYGERMQLECQVHYCPSVVVDILRIDTAQLRIIGERGLIYEQ